MLGGAAHFVLSRIKSLNDLIELLVFLIAFFIISFLYVVFFYDDDNNDKEE